MHIGKHSLAYDLQELFRFLIDLAVISLIERRSMTKADFIRTETYTLRLKPSGVKKVTVEVNAWLNKTVLYQGKVHAWHYIILLKARELAQFLTKKEKMLDFIQPKFLADRLDDAELRAKILDIPYSDCQATGFSKGTLHYLKANADKEKPFAIRKKVLEKLSALEVNA
jgi:CRISPR-associated protein Cas1